MDSGESIEVFKVRTFQIRDLQQNAPERAPESHGYNRMQINSKKSQTDRQFYQSNQLKPIYLGSKNGFFSRLLVFRIGTDYNALYTNSLLALVYFPLYTLLTQSIVLFRKVQHSLPPVCIDVTSHTHLRSKYIPSHENRNKTCLYVTWKAHLFSQESSDF